jgi:hypothetical protein
MSERLGDELLRLPLRLHGIQLGRSVELLLDRETSRAVGFDVLCGDEVRRFLPLPTAAVGDNELTILSPLVLLEEDELQFYRSRTFALGSFRGRPVERHGQVEGTLVDVAFGPDGTPVAVIVERDGRRERLPFDGTIRLAPGTRHAA